MSAIFSPRYDVIAIKLTSHFIYFTNINSDVKRGSNTFNENNLTQILICEYFTRENLLSMTLLVIFELVLGINPDQL